MYFSTSIDTYFEDFYFDCVDSYERGWVVWNGSTKFAKLFVLKNLYIQKKYQRYYKDKLPKRSNKQGIIDYSFFLKPEIESLVDNR